MDEFIAWDFSVPGISFNINSGRITIFKTTLVAMGFPEFFHFLFSPEDRIFGIEPCGIDDGGAYRFPDVITREHYDFKCIDLVRFVYQTCGWKKKLTYRIPGERLAPDSRTILFDLQNALEVHEGRVKEAE
jgi:hypothetical protein